MDVNRLLDLVRDGETERVEFKRKVTGDINREIVAFANAAGGHIIVGVDDDGKVTGADVRHSVETITSSVQSIVPVPSFRTFRLRLGGAHSSCESVSFPM